MKRFVPIAKMSKKAQKAYYANKRSTWGQVKPATITISSGKYYDRKKEKQNDRRIGMFDI